MSKEELIEEILDIIHSENSGLSIHQRVSEIEKVLNQNKEDENELIEFLDWLSEEGICRWYSIEKEYGGEGESDIVERYLKEKDEEVGKSGKVQ